jgi:hypothetical protein
MTEAGGNAKHHKLLWRLEGANGSSCYRTSIIRKR